MILWFLILLQVADGRLRQVDVLVCPSATECTSGPVPGAIAESVLCWDPVADVDGYRVYANGSLVADLLCWKRRLRSGEVVRACPTSMPLLRYTDPFNIFLGRTDFYDVRAYNVSGQAMPSCTLENVWSGQAILELP